MAIFGFDDIASIVNNCEAVLRKVTHMQAKETISGSDLLSGESLVVTCFEFDQCSFYFMCLGETDEIKITKTIPIGHWVSHDISHESPWGNVTGHELNNTWQLSNAKGYDDAVMLQFGNERGNTRLILEAVASRFAVFGVNQN